MVVVAEEKVVVEEKEERLVVLVGKEMVGWLVVLGYMLTAKERRVVTVLVELVVNKRKKAGSIGRLDADSKEEAFGGGGGRGGNN